MKKVIPSLYQPGKHLDTKLLFGRQKASKHPGEELIILFSILLLSYKILTRKYPIKGYSIFNSITKKQTKPLPLTS